VIVQRLPSTTRREALWPWMLVLVGIVCLSMKLGYALLEPRLAEAWLHFWGFVPAEINAVLAAPPSAWLDQHLLGLVTALFVHAEWLHLAGNLAYLWVFGVAVERAIGHWRFFLCFIVLGSLANFAVAWQMGSATAPVIGASGGVSAIIGIYLGLFPNRRMGLWIPLGLYLQFARVPALLVIGSWFILQLLYSAFGPMSGAVAWWSHVAGFLGGLVVALVLRLFTGTSRHLIYDD
jgi:membrane associated rhomboid family serine protease